MGNKVFIVEDDKLYAKVLGEYLKENVKDIELYYFSTSVDCLKNLKADPKIIILDYFLDSQPSGVELIRTIKSIKPSACIIILSYQKHIHTATDTLENGAFEYISKEEDAFPRVVTSINKIIALKKLARSVNLTRRVLVIIAWLILITGALIVFLPNCNK